MNVNVLRSAQGIQCNLIAQKSMCILINIDENLV